MTRAEELEDGIGGAIDSTGGAEAMADFREVAADALTGALVVQQTKHLGRCPLGSEIVLYQLRHGTLSGD